MPADAAALARLSPAERRALLERLLAERAARPRVHPLSYAQQRLWFLDRLDPGAPTYNIPAAVRFTGRLRPAVLERVLAEIARRHETLRTVFVDRDGEPGQVISPRGGIPVRQVDLRSLPADRRRVELRRLAGIEVLHPFDLARGPLARMLLLRSAGTEWVAVLTLHHVIADGWSMGVLIRELRTLYAAFDAGRRSPLPEPPIQYVDFAHWQRRHLDDRRLEPGLAYWRRQLGGELPALDLPTDRPRPANTGFDGRVLWFRLPASRVRALRGLAERLGGTLFMALLGVFSILLARYGDQRELLLGSPVANRHRRELEGLIGVFVNTLVLRADLRGDPPFTVFFERVRETVLGALAHQEVPFERLVEVLRPGRDLARHPFFQVVFVLQNVPIERLELPGLGLEPFELEQRAESFDLTLSLMEVAGEGILGSLAYNTDLFDPTTMTRLVGHFERLLHSVVETPEHRLRELELLSAAERQQLLERWDAAAGPVPEESSVESLFVARAACTPEATAVVDGDRVLSYGALATAAGELAARLRRAGVGSEAVVGVALEPGAEAVVAILAVLRAGGAYLPLDPGHPPRRSRFQLELCRVPVVVTRRRWRELFPGCRTLPVDPPAPATAVETGGAPRPARAPVASERLAYVLFTSGSTGEPKGVAMPHRPLVNLLRWQQRRLPVESGARAAQLAFLGFDVSFQEIFTTLSGGGTLVIVPPPLRRDPGGWPAFLERHRIERFFVPFVGLERLAEAAVRRGVAPAALRHLITAGEQLRITEGIARFCERLPAVTLHNHYGPTESHVVTSHTLTGPVPSWPALPPIGRAIDGAPVRVLDRRLRPVPDGVPGELFLAGSAPGRGYFGRPALTADRFLPDPWGSGGRLYRTGDRGRHRPDGTLEFLGRADRQLKIRGFRIEPGEVEVALATHPSVAEASVVAREGAAGERRLAAFLVARGGAEPAVGELRRFLLERLPEHMVPAAFVFLGSLPTTATGKVDRRALPELAAARPRRLAAPVAARNPTEQRLVEIFSRVLEVEEVGVHDHFLELGGDSILALQVVVRAQRVGIGVTLEQLFAHPTVAGLAEVVASGAAAGAGDEDAEEGGAGDRRAETVGARLLAEHPELEDLYPLAPMQQGILFHHLLGRTAGEYLEYFRGGLGALDLAAFRRAWKEVAARHPALRTLFFWRHRERPFQGVLRELPLPFEVHDLRALDGGAQEARIAAHVTPEALSERFDPGRAPLYHLALFRLADDAWELVWSFHDLILDGWSGPLVLNQVAERYRRLTGEPAAGEPAAGEPASRSQAAEEVAPAPPFRRYLEWLARQDPAPAEEFWRRELAGYEPPPPLTEGRRTAVAEGDPYGRRELTLPAAASDRLRGWARRRRLTLNTLVQAAWGLVLGRWQSREDVVFGSVVSGRPAELAGAAEMVGVPVNTLPVRLRLDSGAPGGSWLEEHQRRQVAARRFEHSSLVEIHRWSGVPREAPLFESIVAFVNYPAVAPGLWRRQRWSPQRIGYPLFLLVRPDRRLYLELTYDRRRFGNAAAARMLGQLRTALEGLSTVPGETLTEVPLLAAGERHQLLVEWNDSARPLPPTTVVEEVGERAREVPERIAAATFGDRSAVVSYGELLRRSAGVAAELAARGLEPGAIVILLAPRGVDFLVAVLALWRAGAAYLPLDPEHPPERLRRILERSGSRWALAASETSPLLAAAVEALPAAGRPRVEELGALIREGGRRPRGPSRALPDGLAYTLFTSGSTGVPKGAMIGHRGMLNHLFAKIRDLELDDRDRVAQTASQCFDVSVWQLVAALLVGGRVEVFERSDAADPERLPAALTAARVTVFETVPSLLRVMLEVAERAAPGEVPWPTGLRWLIPTGEELSAELCRRWLARRPEVPLVNAYGPTECSDDVTHHTLRRPPAATAARTPIGRPVANTRLYLLDRRLRPVPLGGTGALWVGGAGVGWGYLGEAGRTARAFVPDPFVPPLAGGAPDRWGGGRLYFTGDRARHLPGGELEFLGRLDHQVKVRGLRIELGEIETALERRSGVAQAAVIVRPDAAGNDALAAFVMPAAGTTLEVAALRRELRNELPAALVPTFWFELEALPRLPSGKVDRGALARRAPAPAEEVAAVAGGAPRTATEELLAGIWGELLGRARVGLEESFFDLGGHSLLATQMLSRIRSLGAEVPLRRLFEAPTVRALAAEVDRRLAGGGSADERPPPLRPGQRDDPPPLSFAQRRMWLTSRTMDDPSALHVSAPLRISGRLDPAILASALTEVVRRHEVLRTGFPMVDGEPVQVVAPPAPVPLPVIDLRRLGAEPREREAERLSSHLARRPFDLGRGPLLRVGLLRLGPRHHLLVNTLHHVVTDGWSTPILVRELLALYRPFRRGEPSPLPALPIQYADYACWQRRWLTGERRRRQLDYWRRQLAGASPRLALPGERQPGGTASNRGAFHHFELEPETSAGLLRLARELRATPFMTVLAVLEALLHRLTSKTDFVVATDVANREPPEVEGLIGFFVNVVALRADLSGTPTFRQLLERVRQVALGAFAHQQLPFAELLPEVDLEPVPYVGAPFNIYFTLVSEAPEADADESLALPDGATATLIERGSRQAPRDLTLAVRERAGILHGSWLYKTELLTGAAVVRWTESFRKLAAAVVEDPDRPLDELVLRSEEEARRLRGEKEDRQRRSFRKLEKIRPRGTEL